MKVDLFETHDRYKHFTKQSFDISECCQNLIDQRPFGKHAFYIFAHARTEDGDCSKKRLIWQPRLTKPKAQTNSMLFKVCPGTDMVKVIWMIPDQAMWGQFAKGLVTENKTVTKSIELYKSDRATLEAPEPDDLSDEAIDSIYRSMALDMSGRKIMDNLYKELKTPAVAKPEPLVVSL